MAGYMDFINRNNMKMNAQEILTSFEWDVEFTKKPAAVFWPGDDTFHIRLNSVQPPGADGSSNQVQQAEMRGFTLIQSGLTENSGSLSMNFQDFEDQAIVAFLEDWVTKCNTRDTRRSIHKRDLIADIKVTRYNSFRKPVKEWICETCLPAQSGYGDQFTAQKALLGQCSLNLQVEYFTTHLLNLT